MNDADALKEITAALNAWFWGGVTELDTLAEIARITGLNEGAK